MCGWVYSGIALGGWKISFVLNSWIFTFNANLLRHLPTKKLISSDLICWLQFGALSRSLSLFCFSLLSGSTGSHVCSNVPLHPDFILEILISMLLRLFFSPSCPYFEPLSTYHTIMQMSNNDTNMRFFQAHETILSLASKITTRCVAVYLFFCVFVLVAKGEGKTV